LWKFTDKEIRYIKINSVPKNLCKNTKTIIRLRLGDYRGIFTYNILVYAQIHFCIVNLWLLYAIAYCIVIGLQLQ
jgi:hypothetical protein